MSKAKEIYAKRLKYARAKAEMTLKELGVKAGMDEFVASTRVSRYESAKHAPSLDDAFALATALDIPIGYFVTENDDVANLLLTLHNLSEAQCHQVFELAELVESEYI